MVNISNYIKVIHMELKPFLWKSKETMFSYRPLNAEIWFHFQCLSEIWQKLKIALENVFRLSILFQPNLANLQPVTAHIGTGGDTNGVDKLQHSLLTKKHKLYDFKGFAEVTFYDINKLVGMHSCG